MLGGSNGSGAAWVVTAKTMVVALVEGITSAVEVLSVGMMVEPGRDARDELGDSGEAGSGGVPKEEVFVEGGSPNVLFHGVGRVTASRKEVVQVYSGDKAAVVGLTEGGTAMVGWDSLDDVVSMVEYGSGDGSSPMEIALLEGMEEGETARVGGAALVGASCGGEEPHSVVENEVGVFARGAGASHGVVCSGDGPPMEGWKVKPFVG